MLKMKSRLFSWTRTTVIAVWLCIIIGATGDTDDVVDVVAISNVAPVNNEVFRTDDQIPIVCLQTLPRGWLSAKD